MAGLLKLERKGKHRNIYHYIHPNGSIPTEKAIETIRGCSEKKRITRMDVAFTLVLQKTDPTSYANTKVLHYQDNKIWAIKGYQDRFYAFLNEHRHWVLVCYEQKQRDKADPRILKRAEKLHTEYENRRARKKRQPF